MTVAVWASVSAAALCSACAEEEEESDCHSNEYTPLAYMDEPLDGAPEFEPRLLSVQRVPSDAPHSAFSDLIVYNDVLLYAFRAAGDHLSPNGALRILSSRNGTEWASAASITSDDADLRDPRLTLTPSCGVMLNGAAALPPPSGGVTHESRVWFSSEGTTWTAGQTIVDPNMWLWRTTWYEGVNYGIAYSVDPADQFVRLYKSTDGETYEVLVDRLFTEGYPNEHGMTFLPDRRMVVLLRRDGEPNTALLGQSPPPYTDWTWTDLGQQIGGPDILLLPDGRIVAGTRLLDGPVRTSLSWLNVDAGTLTEFISLPSSGDTSYPGLVWHAGRLWVSYYSSHEEATGIYLAQVEIPLRALPLVPLASNIPAAPARTP